MRSSLALDAESLVSPKTSCVRGVDTTTVPMTMETKVRIGIDIDDTLAEFTETLADFFGFDLADIEEWEQLPGQCFLFENDFKEWLTSDEGKFVFAHLQLRPGAWDAIDTLRFKGYEVVFVTARDPKLTHITRTWVDQFFPEFIPIVFAKDKTTAIEHFDILIDDSPEQLFKVSAYRPTIVFDRPWNQKMSWMHRAYSWREVVPLVEQVQKSRHLDVDNTWQAPPFTREHYTEYNPLEGHPANEVRVTNAKTGGQKGSKLERFDLLPTNPLREVARHYGKGASKYEDHNWRRGYDWSLSYAALQRHAQAFWGGEDIDPESGSHHLAAVVFHALAMMEWGETHPELDDRYENE